MNKRLILKIMWYSIILAYMGIGYFSYEMGWLEFLWYADSSKITIAIIGLFVGAMAHLGRLLHKVKEITQQDLDPGFEICDIAMGLGMLGTVVGFIMMTTAFAGVDIGNIENIKQLFSTSTQGMSTALYTTAAGLIVSIKIRVMYYLTQRWLAK
jgi:MotA/TolQ/ExbB proton channel family